MSYVLFHDYFPELAERETRSLTIPPGSPLGLPPGEYGFLESFCDEPGCDCRRVMLTVIARDRPGIQAVIAWGWEDIDFYRRWLKYGDEAEAHDMKGPALNWGSPATELAPALLNLVRNVLLQDPEYVERIKRHYATLREKIDRPKRSRQPKRRQPRKRR
jgi:hypothetical protein